MGSLSEVPVDLAAQEAGTKDAKAAWNETLKAVQENTTTPEDENKKLMDTTTYDENGQQVGSNHEDSKPDDSLVGQQANESDNILDLTEAYENNKQTTKGSGSGKRSRKANKARAAKSTKKQNHGSSANKKILKEANEQENILKER
jgi:hypothetical protein